MYIIFVNFVTKNFYFFDLNRLAENALDRNPSKKVLCDARPVFDRVTFFECTSKLCE